MEVRNVTSDDLDSLANLFDSYRVWYRKNSNIEGAKNFLGARIKNEDSEIFVCSDKGELVGFVQLYPLFSSTRMKKFWLLNDLFVDSNYRGKGLSLKLIEQAKDLVRKTGACGMFLETEITNTIGNKLYPRAGFQLNETTNFYEWEVD
ncbi:GNAT family N-acetyltransferase [Ekhidna sp.]